MRYVRDTLQQRPFHIVSLAAFFLEDAHEALSSSLLNECLAANSTR